MTELISLLRDIVLLRRGPQDVPYSRGLLVTVCVIDLLMQAILSLIFEKGADVILGGAMQLGLSLLTLYALLTIRGVSARFVQTATTILSCAILATLVSVPFLYIFGAHPPTAKDDPSPLLLIVALISLPVCGWALIVYAHIFRNAMNIPFLGGMIVAIMWLMINLAFASAISPAPPEAAAHV